MYEMEGASSAPPNPIGQSPGLPGPTGRPPGPGPGAKARFPGLSRLPEFPPDGARFQRWKYFYRVGQCRARLIRRLF